MTIDNIRFIHIHLIKIIEIENNLQKKNDNYNIMYIILINTSI